jgi:prepilin-type N-terminal cleavage/methylation domain-containing protein
MRKNGFSLIELVIAVSLASFVLVGVATIAAQMARTQVDGIRSGTVSGWSVASYMTMAKEIEDANVLAYPVNNGDNADSIVVCKNWSRDQGAGPPGAALDAALPVSVIQYCVDATDPDSTHYRLRRYANVGLGVTCPASPAAPVTCNAAGPGWTENGIVGFRVEHLNGFATVFWRDNAIGGVRLRYSIGQQTPTTNQPTVKFTPYDFGIAMQKQYSSTRD